jgi:adenylyl-sulfate kinase
MKTQAMPLLLHLRTPSQSSSAALPPGAVVWLTGLSGSGKSTIADLLQARLRAQGRLSARVDGDQLRQGLCANLGFSAADRDENVRRASEVAYLMAEAGLIVLASLISPFEAGRQRIRARFGPTLFLEVHCHSPLEVCEARDVKGLYRRARAGQIRIHRHFLTLRSPRAPELRLDTAGQTPEACVQQVLDLLVQRGGGALKAP